MGPRVDVWADDAALARLGGAPVDSAEGWAVVIGAWRNHQDAIHAWAEQTGRTWRQARTLIPSRPAGQLNRVIISPDYQTGRAPRSRSSTGLRAQV